MDWASFGVEDLVELILRFVALLTMRGAIHSADSIVGLALARGIPLVVGPSSIVVMFPVVVIVATRETTALSFLFIYPALHHVA